MSNFNLRGKILITIVLIWGVMLLVSWQESSHLLENYVQLEEKLVRDDMRRIKNMLKNHENIPLDAFKNSQFNVVLHDKPEKSPILQNTLIALKNGNDILIDGKTRDFLHGFTLAKNSKDQSLGLLEINLPRGLYKTGLQTIYYFNLVIFFGGILFALFVFFMLKFLIINDLKQMHQIVIELRKNKDFSIRIPVRGKDELSLLASEANKMLELIRGYDDDNKKILANLNAELEQGQIISKKLRLVENFLEDIINSMPSILIIIDAEKRILRLNNAAREEAGLARDDDVRETSLYNYFSWMKTLDAFMLQVMQEGKPLTQDKVTIKSGMGNRYFNVLMYPLSSGKLLSICLDEITPMIKIKEKMLENDKLASIGVLTAGVMHEINNPVNFILSAISPMKKDLQDMQTFIDKVQEYGQDHSRIQALAQDLDISYTFQELLELTHGMQDGIDRTCTIINDLQSASAPDEKVLKKMNIHEGIDSTLAILRHRIKHNIKIIRQYDKTLPEIDCYPTRLNQIFMNIITNAIDAILDKGEIFITTVRKDENHVQISFKDNGSGISRAHKDKIFDPFFTTKPVGKGTGLGLSITRSIIEEIKGELFVNSQENQGTEFIIILLINQE